MFSARFDESRDTKTNRSFSIAGYFGRVDEWLELEAKLGGFLQDNNLNYFKASECESGTGECLQFRENPSDASAPLTADDKKRLVSVKTRFTDIVNSVKLLGIGAWVPIEEFNKVISSDPQAKRLLSEDPYFVCFQGVMTEAGHLASDFNHKVNYPHNARAEMLAFMFDENEEVSGRARLMYDDFQRKNPIASEVCGSLTYASDHKSIALQAADNLAYEVMKLGLNSWYDKDRPERKAMARLKERTWKIYRFDKASLEMVVKHNLSRKSVQKAAKADSGPRH